MQNTPTVTRDPNAVVESPTHGKTKSFKQVLLSQNPEVAYQMPKEWVEGVRGAVGCVSWPWIGHTVTQICFLAKTPKSMARRDLTKWIKQYHLHICSFWQEPKKGLLLKFSNEPSHSHPLPSLPRLTHCSASLSLESKPFFLNSSQHSWPFPHERSPLNSALSTTRVGHVSLYNSSLEDIFPIFPLLRQV